MFFTTLFILLPIGGFLFYQIQSRIGEEQMLTRKKFAENNPHLEIYLKRSPAYQQVYSSRPTIVNAPYKNIGGMSDEQKKNLLMKCGQNTMQD
jgi:hypothetical protein